MTETLDVKTFDLAEVLAGRSYPEEEVPVYFNEKLGYTIYKLREAIRDESLRGNEDSAKGLQAQLDTLVADVEGERYTAKVKSVSRAIRDAIRDKVLDEYPIQKDMLGRVEDNLEAENMFRRLTLATYLESLTSPTGAVTMIDEAAAGSLLAQAPDQLIEDVEAAIGNLTSGSKAGFEYAAQELDFLSSASREG